MTTEHAKADSVVAVSIEEQIKACNALEDDKPKQAITLANQLLAQINPDEDSVNYGYVMGCLAWALAVNNQAEKAISVATNLETLTNKLEISEEKISLLRRVGGVFHRTGNRIAAVANYQLAMGLAVSLNLKKQQVPLLTNLGVLNSQIKKHSDAIDNYYLALELIEETESFNYKAPVLFNLAVTLNGQKRYPESLKIYQQVEAMITDQWPGTRAAQVYTGIASAYLGINQTKLAESFMDKTLGLLSKDDNKSVDYYGAKIIYAQILAASEQKQAAETHAAEAWAYFKLPEHRKQLLSLNNPLYSLADVYEQIGNPALSLEIHKMARNVSQEFQDSFNKETMSQMQARLSNSQQRHELTELKTQNALNQLKLNKINHNKERLVLIIIFGSVAFASFLYWQRRTNHNLKQISMRDTLTQLGNRRAIQDWVESRKFPDKGKIRLMWLMDLDLFKHINDEHGHEVGDMVLKKVAEVLTSHIESSRFVGRWGGEEFMLLSDDVAEKDIQVFGQSLLKSIESMAIDSRGVQINLTASMGVSQIFDKQKASWNKALSLADKALYLAKEQGRNALVNL